MKFKLLRNRRQRQEQRWKQKADAERRMRMRTWESTDNSRIEKLARSGGTPLNDYFASGKGVWGLADFVAALERRVDRLEKSDRSENGD